MNSSRFVACVVLALAGSSAFAGTIHHDLTLLPQGQIPILELDGIEVIAEQSGASSLVTTGTTGLGVNSPPANGFAIQPAESLHIRFTKSAVENLKLRLLGTATGANVHVRTRDGWLDSTNNVQLGVLASIIPSTLGSKEIEEIHIGVFAGTVSVAELDATFRELVPGQDLKMTVDPSLSVTKPLRTRLFAVAGMKLVFDGVGANVPQLVVNSVEYEARRVHSSTIIDTNGKHALEFERSGIFDLEFMTSSPFLFQTLTLSTSVDFKRKFDETQHQVRRRTGQAFGEFSLPGLANMQVAFTIRPDQASAAVLGAELIAPDGNSLPLSVATSNPSKALAVAPVVLPAAGFYSLRITGMELDDVVDLHVSRVAPPNATGEVTATP